MDKKVNQEIVGAIEKVIPLLQRNNNSSNHANSVFSSYDPKSKTFVKALTYPESEELRLPVTLLLDQKAIDANYSNIFIEKELFDIYRQILGGNQDVQSLVCDLITKLLQNINKVYFVISEIENIRVAAEGSYALGDSTIKILEKDDLPFDFESPLDMGANKLITKPVIFVRVHAGDCEKAKEYAQHNFVTSFNLLRLYAPNFKPALKGCLLSGHKDLFVYNETGKILSQEGSRTGDLPLYNAYLSPTFYSQLKESGIDNLSDSSSISKIVKECLYWYGLGLSEQYPSAKLLNFVTVLESTLKRKTEQTELSRTISERGAIFLYSEFEQRKKAKKQLKEIYNIRSIVTHTGTLIDDKELASLAGGYARAVLINLIKRSKEFDSNFDTFINYLDDVKLKGA